MNAETQHAETGGVELLGRTARLVMWALVLIGAAAFILATRSTQPLRAWQIYLVNYLFWSGLAIAGVVMAAIWRATNSVWGRTLRGAALATFGFVPISLLAFLPLIAGREYIFPFIHNPQPHRAAWLEPTFLLTRNFLSLLLLYLVGAVYAYFLLRPVAGGAGTSATALRAWLSRGWRGAEEETARSERVLRRLTPVLLILYALVFSLVAFDMVMALDPHFFSTLFGGHYFVTNLYAGWALLAVLLAVWLAREPRLREIITSDELHQLGKLMFGFCMLYGMVFWSQYLVFWYGNLPEEIPFVILRQSTQPWAPVSLVMILLGLPVPFIVLLSAAVKKNPRTLGGIGLVILVGMWLERYILVVPPLWTGEGSTAHATSAAGPTAALALSGAEGPPLPLGLLELAVTAGFAAAFLLCYAAFARAFPITLGLSRHTRAGH